MPETWLFPRTAVPGGVWSVSQVTHATGPRGGASSLLAARVCHSHLCPLRPTGSVPLLPATATATPLPPATTAVTPVPPCSSACALGAPPFSPAFSPVHFPPLQPGLMPRQPLSWRTVPALAFHHRCLTKPHPPPSQVPPTADGEGSRARWVPGMISRPLVALGPSTGPGPPSPTIGNSCFWDSPVTGDPCPFQHK